MGVGGQRRRIVTPPPAQAAPVRYAIGPLTIPIAADALQSWADDAGPGARIVYAWGPVEAPTHSTFVLATELRRTGLVNLHITRRTDGKGFDFLAVRRKADPAPAPERAAATIDETDPDQVMLRELRRAANLGLVCPTNTDLARACGLSDSAAASYRIRKLVAAQLIKIEDMGPNRRRIVTILASGKRTAEGAL